MAKATEAAVAELIGRHALPLRGRPDDYTPLLEAIGQARFVLLGEASHGTAEFYRQRAEITRRLIREKGFNAVAVEADWPDAYQINRYVRADSHDADARAALSGFKRFPAWMWRNREVVDFVEWLRRHNSEQAADKKAGFYGIDLYSLHTSIDAVLDYLQRVDRPAAAAARRRYSCFDHFGQDTQSYGYAASMGWAPSCEEAVVGQLIELRRRAAEFARRDGRIAADDFFFAEQNARLVRNAERYYRSMFLGEVSSWNLRDQHMIETLEALVEHLDSQGPPCKVVVWAHNSHLGDARATEMGVRGELNVGQLMRERHSGNVWLVGFTTYSGAVTAASEWGAVAERKRVRPALQGSFEVEFHGAPQKDFLLLLRPEASNSEMVEALRQPRLERAIGVVYLPGSERFSHYFAAQLSEQFDAVLHFDQTTAVEPLEPGSEWHTGEAPETYPFGV